MTWENHIGVVLLGGGWDDAGLAERQGQAGRTRLLDPLESANSRSFARCKKGRIDPRPLAQIYNLPHHLDPPGTGGQPRTHLDDTDSLADEISCVICQDDGVILCRPGDNNFVLEAAGNRGGGNSPSAEHCRQRRAEICVY